MEKLIHYHLKLIGEDLGNDINDDGQEEVSENGKTAKQIFSEPVAYSEYDAKGIYSLKLNIPKYQRIYTWGYEQVKTLLDDICNIKDLKKYFIGTIILHKHNVSGKEVYDIVDGQQRLVTTALTWYSLSKIEGNNRTIVDDFLKCEYASLEAQQNISNNLKTIQLYLRNPQRHSIIKQNLSHVYFSVLTIEKADNLDLAFTFFSNTNSKGKKLTDYDLLKPHHLRYIPSDFEDQQMHLATKWDDMINKGRDVNKDNDDHKDEREYISYIRVMELMLFRLRNWELLQQANEAEDYHLKKEFEAAPIISEIPPFGERFHFGEPIQGGQHFFAYVDHFIDEYNKFGMKDEDNNYGLKLVIQEFFGRSGSDSWYGTVIEALIFCYFLKFGNNYIYEASMSIIRYISIIRFRKSRAYKNTICEWARTSNIVLEINKATSPTFFLAAIEKQIDIALSNTNEIEDASKGVRKEYHINCCKRITELFMEKTKVHYYQNYYTNRYGMFS